MKKKLAAFVVIVITLSLGFFWSQQVRNSDEAVSSNSTNSPSDTPKFDKTQYSTDDPASVWVVANKTRQLNPKTYAPTDLVEPAVATKGVQQLRTEAAKATEEMFAAAAAEGINLRVDSAYRSYNKQVAVYASEVKSYGQATADTQSARPGYSEHQTGLAADFGAASGKCSIANCFAETPEGKWMAANAYKYGFILRYTPDKVSVTGYRYEPWHFRYVGKPLAEEMHSKKIETLEEFFGLPAAPDYN